MKQEIRYQASAEVVSFIHRWQNWLKDERRYSLHTLDAYSRDLSVFLIFWKIIWNAPPKGKILPPLMSTAFELF